jgi:NADPH:quinone reductase-like Zn-dependent oxidoreductase
MALAGPGLVRYGGQRMKAAVYTRYGPPDVIRIMDVEEPVPKDGEVLIRIRSASVNPLDWHFLRGTPRLGRIVFGLGKPKNPRLGVDVAGQVEAVGKGVTRLKPGDAVFGVCKGAFAEYTCASESKLVAKPERISFEQAAGVPIAALTALQGLRDHGRIQPGQKVLVNGAAGGVGTFAVQIAKAFGAEVTGVCSTRNVDLVRSIGADHVIDYTREDLAGSGQRCDLLLDCVGIRASPASRRALAPKGTYVGIGGGGPDTTSFRLVFDLVAQMLLSWFASQKLIGFTAKTRQEDLATLQELMTSGAVTPVVDRCYPLSDVSEAIRYLEAGHARGKVIITVG